MSTYFFLLGTTPELSLAELSTVLGDANKLHLDNNLIQTELSSDQEALSIFQMLGGSIKLLKFEKQIKAINIDDVYLALADYLAQLTVKINFALTEYGQSQYEKLSSQELKKILKTKQISARYIESGSQGVSASVLLHQKNIQELNIIHHDGAIFLATTLDVQNIDLWSHRDRSKPYSDRKKGMLPPKIARIMVNLAGKNFEIDNSNKTLYDPFCGSGTILMEAMMRGYKVIGSDLDLNSVQGSIKNLSWLLSEYNLSNSNPDTNIFKADVVSASQQDLKGKADLIVTEPFLGKPAPKNDQLEGIFKGLEKMYLGAFQNWTKLLNDEATVVIVFPYVELEKKTYSLEKIIDKLASKGYTLMFKPLFYSRPKAIVQRQIMIFKFNISQKKIDR